MAAAEREPRRIGGADGVSLLGAYRASKRRVIRRTEAMSAGLKDRNMNVSGVLPTTIDTPDNLAAMPGADPSRRVSTQALAEVVGLLASDAARAVHGAAIPVANLS